MNLEREKEYENWFIKRGLPHFIDSYSATSDIFTRLLPFLILLFVSELFFVGDLSRDREIIDNAALVASVVGFVIVFWLGANALRHQKIFEMPKKVGFVELTTFIVLHAFLILFPGQQLGKSIVFLAINLVVTGMIYFGTSYGVVPIVNWTLTLTRKQLGDVFALLVRSLPLLLLFSAIIFLSSEIWQITANNSSEFFLISVGIIIISGLLFAVFKVPSQIEEIENIQSSTEAEDRFLGTPAETFTKFNEIRKTPLSKKQRGNVGLVVVTSEGLQSLLVSSLLFGFFVIFGLFVIPQDVLTSWIGQDPNVLVAFRLFDQRIELTSQLLRISFFVASLSGLYFIVSSLTDEKYKKEFLDELLDEVQVSCDVRHVYLHEIQTKFE